MMKCLHRILLKYVTFSRASTNYQQFTYLFWFHQDQADNRYRKKKNLLFVFPWNFQWSPDQVLAGWYHPASSQMALQFW